MCAPPLKPSGISRREFFALVATAGGGMTAGTAAGLRPIVIRVNVMPDRGAHAGRGLGRTELSTFWRFQEVAQREFANSGLRFELGVTQGAYVRSQGYSEIPTWFLRPAAINLFVTASLGYDIDLDRTGGCSMGPRPPGQRTAGGQYYRTFLGLNEASAKTLLHEYAHHLTLDTRRQPTAARNFWADLRNDYWLWRQRHGTPIPEFRACAGSDWATLAKPG